MEIKRKAYSKLVEWKNRKDHKPLIVEGLRQVGKSYIVNKFAQENYKNVITYGNINIIKVNRYASKNNK